MNTQLLGDPGQLRFCGGIRMWWVSFLTGCLVGAVAAIMIFAIIIAGAEDEGHGKR